MRYAKIIRNPHIILLQYFGFWKHRFAAYAMHSGETIIAEAPNSAGREMLLEVFSEGGDYSFYVPGPEDTVIDIGAYIGGYSILAGKTCKRVLSFEPHPGNRMLLNVNTGLNGMSRKVKISPFAVAETSGKRALYLGGNSMAYSLFKDCNWVDGQMREIAVDCVTLKDIISENKLESVDLLKLDCEGMEYPILIGIDRRTLRKVRRIIFEHHKIKGHPLRDLTSRLKQEGFCISTRRKNEWCSIVYAHRKD